MLKSLSAAFPLIRVSAQWRLAKTPAWKTVGCCPRGVAKPLFPALSYSPAPAQISHLEPSVNHSSLCKRAFPSSSSPAPLFGMHVRKSLSRLYFLTVLFCLIDRVGSSVMSIGSLVYMTPLVHMLISVRRPIVWAASVVM